MTNISKLLQNETENYLLAGTALVALSFMAACTEEDPIANGDGTETPGNNDDGNNDEMPMVEMERQLTTSLSGLQIR